MVKYGHNLTLPLGCSGKVTGLGMRRPEAYVWLFTKCLCKFGYVISHWDFIFIFYYYIHNITQTTNKVLECVYELVWVINFHIT